MNAARSRASGSRSASHLISRLGSVQESQTRSGHRHVPHLHQRGRAPQPHLPGTGCLPCSFTASISAVAGRIPKCRSSPSPLLRRVTSTTNTRSQMGDRYNTARLDRIRTPPQSHRTKQIHALASLIHRQMRHRSSNTLKDLHRVMRVHLLVLAPFGDPENVDQRLGQSTCQRRITGRSTTSSTATVRAWSRSFDETSLTSPPVRSPQQVDQGLQWSVTCCREATAVLMPGTVMPSVPALGSNLDAPLPPGQMLQGEWIVDSAP